MSPLNIKDFDALLKHSSPAFRCYPAGEKGKRRKYVEKLRNSLNSPPSRSELEFLDSLESKESVSLSKFFRKFNGAAFFIGENPDPSGGSVVGVLLYPIREWRTKTQYVKQSVERFGMDFPEWLDDAIAIGTVPHSGNYFLWVQRGKFQGKVMYLMHDPLHSPNKPFASSFSDFLNKIGKDPVNLLSEELGCYTRYSDGKTDTQWIPATYLPNAGVK